MKTFILLYSGEGEPAEITLFTHDENIFRSKIFELIVPYEHLISNYPVEPEAYWKWELSTDSSDWSGTDVLIYNDCTPLEFDLQEYLTQIMKDF